MRAPQTRTGFVLVVGAADAAPVLTTLATRIFTRRVSASGGIALAEVTSSAAAKTATSEPARITTSSTAAATARTSHTASATTGPKIEATGSIEAAERSVPTTSRLVRDKVTAGATVRRTASSTGGSPQALAKALEKAGYKRPLGTAVHHIVARNAAKAKPARDVLQKFGIGIDDAVNGVFLPATKKSSNPMGASVHSTLHTNKYYKAVNRILTSATTRAEVVERLSSIRVRLLRGTMAR